MSTFRGFPACECLVEWLPVFEKAVGRSPRMFQLVGDAPASAGFHRNGGSVDYEPLSEEELRIARNMGGAAWNRWWADNYHSHTRLNGCPHNTIGQPQVADLNEGRDGTGPLYDNAGEPDNGPRDNVHWPLRTWRQGIEWANEQGDEMADPKVIKDVADTNATVKQILKELREFRSSKAEGDRKVRKALNGLRLEVKDDATRVQVDKVIALLDEAEE